MRVGGNWRHKVRGCRVLSLVVSRYALFYCCCVDVGVDVDVVVVDAVIVSMMLLLLLVFLSCIAELAVA